MVKLVGILESAAIAQWLGLYRRPALSPVFLKGQLGPCVEPSRLFELLPKAVATVTVIQKGHAAVALPC